MSFTRRFPALYHVADGTALIGIRRHGLLSAQRLHALHGGDPTWLRHNRDRYRDLAPGAALRRQGMRDATLRPRLDPAITPEDWRWFINGLVFLFASKPQAARFVLTEPARDQVILRYQTAALLDAGIALRTCRFNNGFIDRAPVATARRRTFADYQPAHEWCGDPVREVVASGAIPPGISFTVLTQ